ncbi:MAG: hypothetical protein NTV93_11875 [Verrucomicrobia bacterium]|nr:hypothetical protein [Verrucomicrobiota bacterium]
MHGLLIFFSCSLIIFFELVVFAVLTRLAFGVSEKIARAPLLDIFISLFTWVPWLSGWWLMGWKGFVAAIIAQLVFLHAFCLVHRTLRGKTGRTLTDAQGKILGPFRNQLCLMVQTPAVLVFVQVRLAEIFLYPPVAWLGKLPTYKSSEWVNLSRHKYDGLIGYDLLWCWYCDWMTGLWALGSEMLRNIESFWCPIQFRDERKNRNASTDFPDIAKWAPASGNMEDAVRAFEARYDGKRPNSWWGHPDRNKP